MLYNAMKEFVYRGFCDGYETELMLHKLCGCMCTFIHISINVKRCSALNVDSSRCMLPSVALNHDIVSSR